MVSRFPFSDSDPDRELFRHADGIKIELLACGDKTVIEFSVKGMFCPSCGDKDDEDSGVSVQEPLQDPIDFARSLLSRFAKAKRAKGGGE